MSDLTLRLRQSLTLSLTISIILLSFTQTQDCKNSWAAELNTDKLILAIITHNADTKMILYVKTQRMTNKQLTLWNTDVTGI